MSTEIGKEALFRDNGETYIERIYLGTFNGRHLAVATGYEKEFKKGNYFSVTTWAYMKDLPKEKEKRWLWLKDEDDGTIVTRNYLTDKFAKEQRYISNGWYKSDMFIEVDIKED